MRGVLAAAALLAAALAPGAAEACSVCFSTTEENQWAFIVTTVFLSVLPLGILFGIGAWLRRVVLESERRHERVRVAPAAPAEPARAAAPPRA